MSLAREHAERFKIVREAFRTNDTDSLLDWSTVDQSVLAKWEPDDEEARQVQREALEIVWEALP